MPVEPGLIDANILVYAMDADAPQHAASRALLESARNTSTTVYVTVQILCEFYSVVTNARRVLKPRSPADALSAISSVLSYVHVLPVPVNTIDGLFGLASPPALDGWGSLRSPACGSYESQQHPQYLHV
jgi:predicted nucleic acid-binding protein